METISSFSNFLRKEIYPLVFFPFAPFCSLLPNHASRRTTLHRNNNHPFLVLRLFASADIEFRSKRSVSTRTNIRPRYVSFTPACLTCHRLKLLRDPRICCQRVWDKGVWLASFPLPLYLQTSTGNLSNHSLPKFGISCPCAKENKNS